MPPLGPASLADAYDECLRFARERGGNFNTAFRLLPRAERQAMNVLYAFFRYSDDIADEAGPVEAKLARLDAWREQVESALYFRTASARMLPAICDVVQRYGIRKEWLLELLDGVAQDLRPVRFMTWTELERYCHRVAGVVGFASLRVWGCTQESALGPAAAAGQAFQLTNILRDLRDDARSGRVYLPEELWAPLGANPIELTQDVLPTAWLQAAQTAAERAEKHYVAATVLSGYLPRQGRAIWYAMSGTYHAILDDLRRHNFAPGAGRVGRLRRLRLLAGAYSRRWIGA